MRRVKTFCPAQPGKHHPSGNIVTAACLCCCLLLPSRFRAAPPLAPALALKGIVSSIAAAAGSILPELGKHSAPLVLTPLLPAESGAARGWLCWSSLQLLGVGQAGAERRPSIEAAAVHQNFAASLRSSLKLSSLTFRAQGRGKPLRRGVLRRQISTHDRCKQMQEQG